MRGSRAPGAASPLPPRSLLWQLAVLLAAEVWLYRSYAAHVAEFHGATHFLVGLTAAAAGPGLPPVGDVARPRVPLRPAALRVDGLAGAGARQQPLRPGGDLTWLAVGLAAAGAYAVQLSRWLAARDGARSTRPRRRS